MSETPEAPTRDQIFWKLVETQCSQLRESVAAARVPFLLVMSWAFMWVWALYTYQISSFDTIYDRYVTYLAFADKTDPSQPVFFDQTQVDDFTKFCQTYLFELRSSGRLYSGKDVDFKSEWVRDHCRKVIKANFEYIRQQRLDLRWVFLPGGVAKLRISDLMVMGNLGMILILLWWFYAARRENHAIRAFVDLDVESRRHRSRSAFYLEAQDRHLTAIHLAYAYHAVAQRFLLIFSTYDQPLVFVTRALCGFPAFVATIHFSLDIYDFIHLYLLGGTYELSTYLRTLAEAILLSIVWFLTWRILVFVVDTSQLLNGWYLAAKKVWVDGSTDPPAPRVYIDVDAQTAT